MKVNIDFPRVPSLIAKWWPVQLEPIIGSGELITIGIAAISNEGSSLVRKVISERAVNCVYGENGKGLLNMVEICMVSLRDHINSDGDISEWRSPFEGVKFGNEREGVGSSLEAIIKTATEMTASLGEINIDTAVQLTTEVMRTNEPVKGFAKSVKDYVVSRKPIYKSNFGVKISLVQGGTNTFFDYCSGNYVANLTELSKPTTGSLTNSLNRARLKLWILDQYRFNWIKTQNDKNIELILKKLTDDEYEISSDIAEFQEEIIFEIKEEARSRELNIFEVEDAAEASDRIIHKEEAA
jgi:hypothetical protein